MTEVTLTCPHCGALQSVAVPSDACLAFLRCGACGKMVVPKEDDCCVVCSYSAERCPVSVKTA